MSPERLDGECEDDFKDYVYAYGSFFYELLTRSLPREGHKVTQIINHVCTKELLPEHPTLDEAPPFLAALMRRCVAQDPEKRPTFKEIVQSLEGETNAAPAIKAKAKSIFAEFTSCFRGVSSFSSRNRFDIFESLSFHVFVIFCRLLAVFFRDDASKKLENGKSLENLKIENTRLLR